jgi:hypothetical protein
MGKVSRSGTIGFFGNFLAVSKRKEKEKKDGKRENRELKKESK